MSARKTLVGLAACAAVAAGCGGEEAEIAAAPPGASRAERQAELEKNPYDVRCTDIRDKLNSARVTRIVQYALAADARISGLTQLQSSQSIYYAMTELCKGKPGSYQPAQAAIDGVRSGEYRADLGAP